MIARLLPTGLTLLGAAFLLSCQAWAQVSIHSVTKSLDLHLQPPPPRPVDDVTAMPQAVPLGRPENWVRASDYPAEAFRDHFRGHMSFALIVAENGVPAECEIEFPANAAERNDRTCALLIARARFKPPVDDKGRIVRGSYSGRIQWPSVSVWVRHSAASDADLPPQARLTPRPGFHASGPVAIGRPGDWASDADYPAGARQRHSQGFAGFRLTVSASGYPSACEITHSTGDAELDARTCAIAIERARFKPAMDNGGNAIPGFWTSAVRWQLPVTH